MVNSNIEGIVLTKLKQIHDERGSVLHMIRSDSKEFVKFGECYFSEVLPKKIKAWKCHRLQTQNLAVPVGIIKIVIYDSRENSNSKGLIEEFTIGRNHNYLRIKIPPGLWYGFSCLSNEKALLVNCSDLPHDQNESETKEINDPSIPYSWNI